MCTGDPLSGRNTTIIILINTYLMRIALKYLFTIRRDLRMSSVGEFVFALACRMYDICATQALPTICQQQVARSRGRQLPLELSPQEGYQLGPKSKTSSSCKAPCRSGAPKEDTGDNADVLPKIYGQTIQRFYLVSRFRRSTLQSFPNMISFARLSGFCEQHG